MTAAKTPAAGIGRARVTALLPNDFPFELPFLVRALAGDAEVDLVPVQSSEMVEGTVVRFAGRGTWFAAEARWRRPAAALERWDVDLEVTSISVTPIDAGLQVSVRLGATDDPHWLIPGLFYGTNRAAESRVPYPHIGPETDAWAASSWGFRVDRAAHPVVFGRDGEHGIALATTELGPLGLNGLGFGVDPESRPELRLAFPYREEPVAYDGSGEPRPADLQTHRWQPAETVRLTFRAYRTAATPYAWVPVLDDLGDELAATSPLNPWLEPAAAADLAAEGLARWHVRATPPVIIETAAFERRGDGSEPEPDDREAMHVAWLSGAPTAAALLAHGLRAGDDEARAAATAVLDHVAANLAPCGTFWGQWTADRGWGKGWTPGEERLHGRTLAEAALFMGRAASLVVEADRDAAARWRAAVDSNLAFVSGHQRGDGAIPASWHGLSGEATSWAGSSALAWVPALTGAAAALGRPALVETARRAGAFYAGFVESEFLFGAPEDVDLGPTSEDGYVAVMAYVALAEASPPGPDRDRWLQLASLAADWTLTFRYAWNVAFDPSTTLGRLDFRTRGLDQASPANQHVHVYGLIALAETIRLGRMTGNRRFIERSREHFAAARQLIARHEGDFGARRGMMPERGYQTACFGPKGEIGRLSHAWCLGLLLWTCEAALDMPELTEPS